MLEYCIFHGGIEDKRFKGKFPDKKKGIYYEVSDMGGIMKIFRYKTADSVEVTKEQLTYLDACLGDEWIG